MSIFDQPFLFDDNKKHLLSEFKKEKGYVLFFYPKAGTPGCTLETIEYNKHYQEFVAKGYNVIGISRDNPTKQNKFKCNHEIQFPLICDMDSTLCHEFKVLKNKKMFNNTFLAIDRSTFVIDNNYQIIHEWRSVKPVQHIEAVLNSLT